MLWLMVRKGVGIPLSVGLTNPPAVISSGLDDEPVGAATSLTFSPLSSAMQSLRR